MRPAAIRRLQGDGFAVELAHRAFLTLGKHLLESFGLLSGQHNDIGLVDDGIEGGVGIVLFLIAEQCILACILAVLIETLGIVAAGLSLELLGMALYVGACHVGGIEESVAEDLVLSSIHPGCISSFERSARRLTG